MWWVISYLKTCGDNFGKVAPRIYRSAQPDTGRLVKLRNDIALQAVLDLRHDSGKQEQHKAEVEAAGLLWYPVPMLDDKAPSHEQIAKSLKILRSGLVTLIHCKGGRHRSGLVVAVYRVAVQHWTKSDAWREAEKYGWYDHAGHRPLRIWFENDFDPARFQ